MEQIGKNYRETFLDFVDNLCEHLKVHKISTSTAYRKCLLLKTKSNKLFLSSRLCVWSSKVQLTSRRWRVQPRGCSRVGTVLVDAPWSSQTSSFLLENCSINSKPLVPTNFLGQWADFSHFSEAEAL